MVLFGRFHSLLVSFRSSLPNFLTLRTCMPDNFYDARHRLSFVNNNLLIKVTTSASFQGHVIDSVNCSIGLSMPHLGVSLEVPFIENITLTELGPPPSLTMCLLCTKPALNHLFCNGKKAESRQHPCNSHSRNAPCLQ